MTVHRKWHTVPFVLPIGIKNRKQLMHCMEMAYCSVRPELVEGRIIVPKHEWGTATSQEGSTVAKKFEIYKCETCGNIVEILHGGAGDLVCCGSPMKLMVENKVDASKEKHVPVIEKTEQGYRVKVGSVPHPMIDTHYIEWIALCADGIIHRKYLKPGDAPEAEFCTAAKSVTAHEWCNLHGLWKA